MGSELFIRLAELAAVAVAFYFGRLSGRTAESQRSINMLFQYPAARLTRESLRS